MVSTILVVEDNRKLADLFKEALEDHFEVRIARTLRQARACLLGCSGVLLDLQLPDGDGLSLMGEVKRLCPGCAVIVVTAYGTVQRAVEALRMGASDFFEKPVDLDELCRRFLDLLYPACEDEQFVANSLAMQEVIRLSKQVASTPFPVLIFGPTGSGKEVVARYIHKMSGRKSFVSINCATVPRDLADSLLFGHLKGSFTGASETRQGLVAAADQGTLFLDEIGEMPLSLQPKLLRFLDSGEYLPLGGSQPQRSNARIIAATNRDLKKEISQDRFREDLFFRLATFPIRVPALSERKEEISALCRFHLKRLSQTLERPIEISPGAIRLLEQYPFPGNVRELFNILDQGAVLSQAVITEEVVKGILKQGQMIRDKEGGNGDFWHETRAQAEKREKEMILAALAAAGGNKAAAARALKVSYKTLLNKMKKFGI